MLRISNSRNEFSLPYDKLKYYDFPQVEPSAASAS